MTKGIPINAYELNTEDRWRFWEKVKRNRKSGCWEWTAGLSSKGYGIFRHKTKSNLIATRVSLFWAGIDPGELFVLHRCDNRKCVNPDHLFVGTQADNMDDMVNKGRSLKGEASGRSKLTEEEIKCIRKHRGVLSKNELACLFGVTRATIKAIHQGKIWRHLNAS